jgi:hypothetical protein
MWKAQAGYTGSPTIKQLTPVPGALWRTGDFLAQTTTGTITYPTPVGAMIATAGPSLGTSQVPFAMVTSSSSVTQGVVTVTASSSAGVKAATYWCQVAYANGTTVGATSQSLPSAGFLINCADGLLPVISVSATGQPGSSGSFLAFFSTIPGTYWFQGGAATGSTVTGASPLTNSIGINKGTASMNSNIAGMADCDSDAGFFSGVGGNPGVGKRNIFGPTLNAPPGWTADVYQLPVVKCQQGFFLINLVQQWNGQLYTSVGLNIDSTTGYFVADTTQTACATIQDKPFGPGLGDVGDTYAKVLIQFTASTLI